jgi:hypothetical protein
VRKELKRIQEGRTKYREINLRWKILTKRSKCCRMRKTVKEINGAETKTFYSGQ